MIPNPQQPPLKASTVIRNIGQLITVAQQPIAGATGPLQVIADAAIAVHDGVIVWIGHDDDAEPLFQSDSDNPADSITLVDPQPVASTPGLLASHTHLLFAGTRPQN